MKCLLLLHITLSIVLTSASFVFLFRTDELEVIFFNSSSPVVHEGKDTDFNLLLQSNKSHECLWFHNGYLITNSSSRYRMSSVVNENGTTLHTLHIGNVLQRDQGLLQWQAWSRISFNSHQFKKIKWIFLSKMYLDCNCCSLLLVGWWVGGMIDWLDTVALSQNKELNMMYINYAIFFSKCVSEKD